MKNKVQNKRHHSCGSGLPAYLLLGLTFLSSVVGYSQNSATLLVGKELNESEMQQQLSRMEMVSDCIYLLDNSLKTFGPRPSILYSDVKSLPALKELPTSIDFVSIKISERKQLQQLVDLSVFSNFSAIRTVFILCEITIENNMLLSAIKNVPANCSVFLINSKPN